MGAGACPEQTKAELLREASQLNLGFSESQLSDAIKHLVKEYGSVKDAPAWIRQDNYSVLINYILDHADSKISRPTSEVAQGQTEQYKSSEIKEKKIGLCRSSLFLFLGMSRLQRRAMISHVSLGGKPSLLSKEAAHGRVSGRTDCPKTVGSKVDHQKDSSIYQKRRFEEQKLHSHRREKLQTNFVNDSQDSLNAKVSEVKNIAKELIVATQENARGHGLGNKAARMALNQVQHVTPILPEVNPLQMLYAQSITEDHLTKQKIGKEMNELVSTQKKKRKFHDPEVMKDSLLEARTLLPSGCEDLATGLGNHQDVRSSNAAKFMSLKSLKNRPSSSKLQSFDDVFETIMSENPLETRHSSGKLQSYDKVFETEDVTKHWAERTQQANGSLAGKPCFLANRDKREGLCRNSSRVKSNITNSLKMVGETCTVAVPSSGAQQSDFNALNKSVPEDSEPELLFLKTIEASLGQGNYESALKVLKAWELERKPGGARQTEDIFLQVEGKGYTVAPDVPGRKKGFVVSYDISRGLERQPISCVNEYNTEVLPENFLYVTRSVIRQAAHVDTSLSRIGDLHCCCSDDCLRSSEACKCTDSTRGEYAYDKNGLLIERLAIGFFSGCRTINGDFITECCDKCRCNMRCGNRIVQRGVMKKLQVFMTRKKGWGVRALEKIPARSFVFEYLGEIATNSEQYDRNLEYRENGVYTYVMCLDADLDMENKHFGEGLTDHEALVLDATIFGNVSRFVNHRCNDANLFMRPVQIDTRDTHYYHAALFAARDIGEMEELTWDYGIDFEDDTHLLKAFKCHCKSLSCRDKARHLKQDKAKKQGL